MNKRGVNTEGPGITARYIMARRLYLYQGINLRISRRGDDDQGQIRKDTESQNPIMASCC